MRRTAAPSEVRRLAAPLGRLLDTVWQRMHWWVVAMMVVYAASGTTIVKPDEVAVVLRWGRLVGDTPALREHTSGLLFAFPRPVDTVVRVPVKHVYEVAVNTLAPGADALDEKLDGLMNTFQIQRDKQQTLVAHFGVISPAIVAYEGLAALAGNGSQRYSLFQRQVDAFHEQWRDFFGPRILDGVAMTEADVPALPRFTWREEDVRAMRHRQRVTLISLLAPTGALGALATWRLRRFTIV